MFDLSDKDGMGETSGETGRDYEVGRSPKDADKGGAVPEYTEGEYSYLPPEGSAPAYSDAGYVPSASAGSVPPRYYVPKEREKKQRAERTVTGVSVPVLVAVCLCCALIGGALSTGFGQLFSSSGGEVQRQDGASAPVSAGVSHVSGGDSRGASGASGSELLDAARTQTVAIVCGAEQAAVTGSGLVISSNGYILTSCRAVSDALDGGAELYALSAAGEEYPAALVGYEAESGVAVLKTDAEGLAAAPTDETESAVGDTVYAVGYPLDARTLAMTCGTVSAVDVSAESAGGAPSEPLLLLDITLLDGNLGGPLYNGMGRAIGIVTSADGGAQGKLGFALPIGSALKIAGEIITNGYVTGKAELGARYESVSDSVARFYAMPVGAYVNSVTENGCADRAGIQTGDIITALGEENIASAVDLTAALRDYRAGDSAQITVCRGGEYLCLKAVFDEKVPEKTALP